MEVKKKLTSAQSVREPMSSLIKETQLEALSTVVERTQNVSVSAVVGGSLDRDTRNAGVKPLRFVNFLKYSLLKNENLTMFNLNYDKILK